MRNIAPRPILLFFLLSLCSCVNLKTVRDYSKTSTAGISKFEELKYSFSKVCNDRCLLQSVAKNAVSRETDCNCAQYTKADSVTLVLYTAIKSYFGALGDLADNEITNYSFDPLRKALTEEYLPVNDKMIEVSTDQVTSYSKIASLLSRATIGAYRRKKLRDFVDEGNEPIKTLLSAFQKILTQNLSASLDFRKERLHKFYNEIVLDTASTIYERRKATEEYYDRIDEVNSRQKQIAALAKSLQKISDGHDKLSKSDLKLKDLEEILPPILTDIRALISEFNKLKKSES